MPSKALTVETLDTGAKRAAYQAIDAMHVAYYERGGLRDTVDKLRDKLEDVSERVSQHIYRLAIYASKHAATPEKQRQLFLVMCDYAEQRYKEERGITNMKDPDNGLPVWPVYKSNIVAGFKLRVPLLEYRSEYEYRKAVTERKESAKELPSNGDGSSSRAPAKAAAHTPSLSEARDLLSDSHVTPTLQRPLASLVYAAEQLDRDKVRAAERIFQDTLAKLSKLLQ